MKLRLLSVIFLLSSLTTALADKIHVTVLPIISSVLNEDTRLFLTDQFRQYLRITDSFTVMSRDVMNEILNEQEFQMSESCDQTSCMVQVGKLVGAQSIVSLIVIEDKINCYSASCKLISVETGEIIAQASETRTGEKIETIEWILRNIAGVIAGKPTIDHTMYLSEQDKISKKRLQKYKLTLQTQGSLPIRICTDDPNIPRRLYYDKDTTIREWGLPEKEFNYGLGLGFSMKLHERFWLKSLLSFNRSNESREFTRWNENLENAELNHISHAYIKNSLFDLSFGLETILFRSTHFQFTFTTMPLAGYGRQCISSIDTINIDTKIISGDQYTGQTTMYLYQNSKTIVDGFITGGDLGVTSSINFKTNWSFDISLNARCILAPELEGETKVSQRIISFSPLHPNGSISDSTYSYRAAAVRGDFLGTGEYIKIRNPDEKIIDDTEKKNVSFKKSLYEFSSLGLRIGISYYF